MVKILESILELAPENQNAILVAILRGKEIAKDNPEIAELFVDSNLRVLAKDYSLDYDPSPNARNSVAINSIRYALISLLGEERYKQIAKTHKRKGREKDSKKVQMKGYENGLGRMSKKKRLEASRKGLIASGCVPYDETDVRETEYGLLSEADYAVRLREEGLRWKSVALKVNSVYFHNRSSETLSVMYRQLWRKKNSL